MRREYVIFYAENHIFGNAIRRCLLYKNKHFYREIVLLKRLVPLTREQRGTRYLALPLGELSAKLTERHDI